MITTTRARKRGRRVVPKRVGNFVDSVFGDDMHTARVKSIANATLGVLRAGSLAIHAIGRGLAAARGLMDKHCVKQVDRLLSNPRVDVWNLFEHWVPFVLRDRNRIFVNLDWTEFDGDNQSMIVLSLQTEHGRSTPLLWKTVVKSELKGRRNDHEDEVLVRLRELVGDEVKVTIVADRGFSDQKLYRFVTEELDFEYIIRFRGCVHVADQEDETRKASEWLGKRGRMRVLRNSRVTAKRQRVSTVVIVRDKGMKDIWCLAASEAKLTGRQIKKAYGKRFTCEETFRDVKDMRFGLGMKWTSISVPIRRDRMMLIAAIAHVLLTMLGAAGERCGIDRMLKTNTSRKRTLSLFRQGLRWYDLIPTMPEARLRKLMNAFAEVMLEHRLCQEILGIV